MMAGLRVLKALSNLFNTHSHTAGSSSTATTCDLFMNSDHYLK